MTAERLAEIRIMNDDNGNEYASERVWRMLNELLIEYDRICSTLPTNR
jgi:hypothetical protein